MGFSGASSAWCNLEPEVWVKSKPARRLTPFVAVSQPHTTNVPSPLAAASALQEPNDQW
jgi:hypothetical protein